MPAKVWVRNEQSVFEPQVFARGKRSGRPEDLTIADDLDRAIDRALDEAERLRSQLSNAEVPERFTSAWAVGRALKDERLGDHPGLEGEDQSFLWEVMAAKAVAAVRSTGTPESGWVQLRPPLDPDRPTARQGGRKGEDYWSMCVWLADQDYGDAAHTFGGSIRNVWQMLDRPTLRPLVLRNALRHWFASLPSDVASQITSTRIFPELMKELVKRWPSRGRRSAMQPMHYEPEELQAEIERVASQAGVVRSLLATEPSR